MDRRKYSVIAHRDHAYCNPVSSASADEVLAALDLAPGSRVLDVGCGKAEWLVQLHERYEISADGVDPCEAFLQEGRRRLALRAPAARIDLHATTAAEFEPSPRSYDLALCVGSTHAYGGYRATLEALSAAVRTGGLLLVGEGYWRREPSAEYLRALDCAKSDLTDFAGNVRVAVEAGLRPLYWLAASEHEWDRYESLYLRAMERYCRETKDDPDVPAMLERAHRWRDLYLAHGRNVLGFGLYLFSK